MSLQLIQLLLTTFLAFLLSLRRKKSYPFQWEPVTALALASRFLGTSTPHLS